MGDPMTAPLGDRLAAIFESVSAPSEAALWPALADALLASEEWRAREAVVDAATQLDAAIYSLKREHELHADEIALHEALARLDAVRGEEKE